jgi:hypothetical protein
MQQVLQNRQRLLDNSMGFTTLDIDHEADAAGIMLVSWVV